MIIYEWDILSFRPVIMMHMPSEWIEYKKSISPSVSKRHGVAYEADRSRHPE